MSLSEYLVRELKKRAELATEQDMWERFKNLTPIDLGSPGAELVRAAREERERYLHERHSDEAVLGRR